MRFAIEQLRAGLSRIGSLDAVGLLDEGYFMYFEEVDFCLKAARAGWPCWYVPSSRVVHLVGQSSGVTRAKAAPDTSAIWSGGGPS